MAILYPRSTKINLYRDPVVVTRTTELPVPVSGSLITVGWRSSDLVPSSGSLIFSSGSLCNGNISTIVTPLVSTNWSIGVHTSGVSKYSHVQLYDSGSYSGYYFSGSHSTLDIYTSGDNVTYDWYNSVVAPSRMLHSGSAIFRTIVPLPVGCRGTYLKLHASDGPLKDPIGNAIRYTEIRVDQQVDNQVVSGSAYSPTYGSIPTTDIPVGTTTEVLLKSFGASAMGE